jgi:hypothetical protein
MGPVSDQKAIRIRVGQERCQGCTNLDSVAGKPGAEIGLSTQPLLDPDRLKRERRNKRSSQIQARVIAAPPGGGRRRTAATGRQPAHEKKVPKDPGEARARVLPGLALRGT